MVTEITYAWVKIGEDGKLLISLDWHDATTGYSKVKLEKPLVYTMGWSVEDFIHRAIELEEDTEGGKSLYDPNKFKDALHHMVDNHDASLGITWDTVDFWLDEMCLLEEEGNGVFQEDIGYGSIETHTIDVSLPLDNSKE